MPKPSHKRKTVRFCLFLALFSSIQILLSQDSLELKLAFGYLEEAKACYRNGLPKIECDPIFRQATEASDNHPFIYEQMLAFLLAEGKYDIAKEFLSGKRTDTLSNGLRARHAYFRGLVELKSGFPYFKDAFNSFEEAYKYELWSNYPSFKFLSQIQNALGYIKMIYSGPNKKNAEDYPHPNWITPDLLRSLRHFEQALYFEPENSNAATNRDTLLAKVLCESISLDSIREITRAIPFEILKSIYVPELNNYQDTLDEVNVNYLPNNKAFISQLLSQYQELLIVADISGSMDDIHPVKMVSRFRLMRELVLYLFHEIPRSTAMGIVSVGRGCQTEPTLFYPVVNNERGNIIKHIKRIGPDGHTPLAHSIGEGLSLLSKVENRKALFLISDGVETCTSPLDLCVLAGNIHSLGIDIHVISFLESGEEKSEDAYEIYNCMTQYSGGRVFQYDEEFIEKKPIDYEPFHEEVLLLPPILPGENLRKIRHFVVDLSSYFPRAK